MRQPIRLAALAAALVAACALAAEPAFAARAKVYRFQQPNLTWFNPKFRGCPRGMIVRERGEPPRWGYIGPHYRTACGPGYHTNGPGIGIVR
jgi:hypothetical protein